MSSDKMQCNCNFFFYFLSFVLSFALWRTTPILKHYTVVKRYNQNCTSLIHATNLLVSLVTTDAR